MECHEAVELAKDMDGFVDESSIKLPKAHGFVWKYGIFPMK